MVNAGDKIRWGILGPGNIATQFVSDLGIMPDAEVVAVASRSIMRARGFSNMFKIKEVYASYEEMLKNAEIDIVYVATPNSLHRDHSLLAMQNGVSVLCEKPVALDRLQLAQLITKSQAQNLFFMEGLWTRFIPAMEKIRRIIDSGELGEVEHVEAAFCFDAPVDIDSILYDPKFGGGSLLDVGIYPVFLSYILLGMPTTIVASGQLHPCGSDQICLMDLSFRNGATASLKSSIVEDNIQPATITLTRGKIIMQPEWHISSELLVLRDGAAPETIACPPQGLGFTHEIEECHRCLSAGLIESPRWSHRQSLDVMTILDEVRKQIGVVYEG